jgi:putative ABC transport system ATP-binding protein
LCDEPTGNLDAETGARTIELFQELHREQALTIVAVTHEERLAKVADRVVRLHEGRVEEPAVLGQVGPRTPLTTPPAEAS